MLVEGFRPGVAERLGIGPDAAHGPQPAPGVRPDDRLGPGRPAGRRAPGTTSTTSRSPGCCSGIGPAPASARTPPVNYSATSAAARCCSPSGCWPRCWNAQRPGRRPGRRRRDDRRRGLLTTILHGLLGTGAGGDARGGNLLDGGAPYYPLRPRDGRYIAVGALEPKFWAALLAGAGPGDDPDLPARTTRPVGRLRAPVTAAFAERTRDEWAAVFAAWTPASRRCSPPARRTAHPHNAARGTFVEVGGEIQPAPAPRFDRTPADRPAPAPDPERDVLPVEEILTGWQ